MLDIERLYGAARRLAGGKGLIAVNVMRALNEYAAYVPEVFGLVAEGAGEQKLMNYLLQVEGDAMGLAARPSHARRIAEMLLEWRDVLEQKYGDAP